MNRVSRQAAVRARRSLPPIANSLPESPFLVAVGAIAAVLGLSSTHRRPPQEFASRREIPRLVSGVPRTDRRNLRIRHVACPNHAIPAQEVMGSTRITPVANRWIQRNGVAIEGQRPVRGRNWRHHFHTTTAKTEVDGRCILRRDIQNTLRKILRHELRELERKLAPAHFTTSLVRRFVFVV